MNFGLLHFIRPYWLFALLPWLVIVIVAAKHKLQHGSWTSICDEALLPYLLQEKPTPVSRLPFISAALAAFFAIIALAGPTWERIPSPAFRNDSGLVIALDLSRSMEAADLKPSRLIRARYKIADMLKQRKDGQTALLVYAGDAFTVTPLTNDNATIANQLEALTPDIMPSFGSNTVAAVEKAAQLLKQAGLQKGVILLITDDVKAGETAAVLKQLGHYQLSVLAVGTAQGAPISLPEGGFLKDENDTIVVAKVPIAELQKLAQQGGGVFQTLTDDDGDVKTLLATVDNGIQTTAAKPQNNLLLEKWDEKGVWLLLLILPLAALNFRRGLLTVAFLLLLPLPKNSYALEWQDLWQTKDQQAYQAYQKGDYEKAAKLFENPEWQAAAGYKSQQMDTAQLKTPTTATGFYNQGNVLAKAGKLEEALQAYNQALRLNPDKKLAEDAQYNKKLVEDALKQQHDSKDSKDKQDNSQNSQNNKQRSEQKKQGKNKPQDSENAENKQNKDSPRSEKQDSQENKQNQQQPDNTQPQPTQNSNQNAQNSKNSQQNQQASQQKQTTEKNQARQQTQAAQNEKTQANQQWLNRIPDDPAGLLRRKFQYQYSQQQQPENNQQAW